jgi:hypothetical protein
MESKMPHIQPNCGRLRISVKTEGEPNIQPIGVVKRFVFPKFGTPL